VQWRGKTVTTSIFKAPVTGRVRVSRLNLAGDEQSDLTVHGGVDKAVYVYPSEHYPYWREQLPDFPLPWGAFGENFTTDGLSEKDIHIGDRLRIGTAEFEVTQPRMPCFKLGIRFDRADMVKRFLRSGRSGFYLRVLKEGDVSAGDSITSSPRRARRFSCGRRFPIRCGRLESGLAPACQQTAGSTGRLARLFQKAPMGAR